MSSQYLHLDVVKLLIEHGADITELYEYTLCYCIKNNLLDMFNFLVENGAIVNLIDINEATRRNRVDMMQILVENSANIYRPNDTELYCALLYNRSYVVELLARKYIEDYKIIPNHVINSKRTDDSHQILINYVKP